MTALSRLARAVAPARLAALLLPLLAAACEVGPAAPRDTRDSTTPALLGQRLPPAVGAFRRGTVAPLPARDGVEIPFSSTGVPAAAAIVQILPAPDRPETDAAPVEAALAAMVRESMQSRATRRVRERGPRFTLPAAGPARLLCAETEGAHGRQQVEGLLCAGRFTASLVQLRVTMPLADPPPADPRAFAAAVAAHLATPPQPAGTRRDGAAATQAAPE